MLCAVLCRQQRMRASHTSHTTGPLHPSAPSVQMYVKRDIDGAHVNFNIYHLFTEQGDIPVLSAYKHHHLVHNYYEIKMHASGKKNAILRTMNSALEPGLLISQLELNFMGTEFLLHNASVYSGALCATRSW